jgi:hypothetical protein
MVVYLPWIHGYGFCREYFIVCGLSPANQQAAVHCIEKVIKFQWLIKFLPQRNYWHTPCSSPYEVVKAFAF